jgi:hypothetical protein
MLPEKRRERLRIRILSRKPGEYYQLFPPFMSQVYSSFDTVLAILTVKEGKAEKDTFETIKSLKNATLKKTFRML